MTTVYWSRRSKVLHTRATCGVRRVGDQRESAAAIQVLPTLAAEGRRLCRSCAGLPHREPHPHAGCGCWGRP